MQIKQWEIIVFFYFTGHGKVHSYQLLAIMWGILYSSYPYGENINCMATATVSWMLAEGTWFLS